MDQSKGEAVKLQSSKTHTHPPWLATWLAQREALPLGDLTTDPSTLAIFSADMIVGFCNHGSLASERVGALAAPVADLFQRAHDQGVRQIVLLQDDHHPNTPEFNAYPPHCVRGTDEAETIAELQNLPFAGKYTIFEKNSLNPAIATGFDAWLDDHPAVTTAIVVGNCTDLCTYQLAMHLRMRANARNITGYRVIVPADCVDTYDLSPETATETGAMAHPADFFHPVFLYHLALNGIEVVTSLP